MSDTNELRELGRLLSCNGWPTAGGKFKQTADELDALRAAATLDRREIERLSTIIAAERDGLRELVTELHPFLDLQDDHDKEPLK